MATQDVDSNAAGVKVQAGSCACAEKIRKGLLVPSKLHQCYQCYGILYRP